MRNIHFPAKFDFQLDFQLDIQLLFNYYSTIIQLSINAGEDDLGETNAHTMPHTFIDAVL